MTPKNETFASAETSLKSGFDQWQSATEAWNRMAVETLNANMRSAAAMREQMGTALAQGSKRATELAAREQAEALESFEAMQAVARESFERMVAAGRTAADTGRVLMDETVKMAEEQSKALQAKARTAQEHAAEWAEQGTEVLAHGLKVAKK